MDETLAKCDHEVSVIQSIRCIRVPLRILLDLDAYMNKVNIGMTERIDYSAPFCFHYRSLRKVSNTLQIVRTVQQGLKYLCKDG